MITQEKTWMREDAILAVNDMVCSFKTSRGTVYAVSGVSFDIREGETLGVVGESGCGKSTTGRAMLRLTPARAGSVTYRGIEIMQMRAGDLKALRREIQMIFQDPISSLNPRRKVADVVGEGLKIAGAPAAQISQRVAEAITEVGLDPHVVGERRPGQFSGGQCQRIAIARAMAVSPQVLVCDEPVSALDVSAQAQVLNILEDMKQEHGLSMMFISHDLAVVRNVSDRIAVMYLGTIVEIGEADAIYERPAHPYTSALLNAVPVPDPAVKPATKALGGDIASPLKPPSGCRFRTRCPIATELCARVVPQLHQVGDDHHVACHFPLDERRSGDQFAAAINNEEKAGAVDGHE